MGREVRKVPKNWEHPKNEDGRFIPMHDGYGRALEDFREEIERFGLEEALINYGGGPIKDDYMPDWPEEERTHYMMYEDTSEGTPISPAFSTPEELARWLADNNASAFGHSTATYEQWLAMIGRGWAVSGVMLGGQMVSGVEFCAEVEDRP